VKRFAVPALVSLAAVGLLALLLFGLLRTDSTAKVAGRAFPAKALPVLNGTGVKSLAAWRGKVVVVNVFASWCPPCKTETPLLEREHRRLLKRGATVVGITYDDAPGDTRAFAQRNGVTFPILRDAEGSVAHALGVRGVPETFVLDRTGRIVAVRRAPVTAASGFLSREVERRL
jgi:cytochrome c biogenesis protein CcmG/thiol:disulfide interchange protein DsbE